MRAAGVVVVSSHWNRAGDPATVIVDVDAKIAAAHDSVALAERIAVLLKSAGLTPDLGGLWPRDSRPWSSLVAAFADCAIALVHISIPARYGTGLVTLAAAAIQRLRHEGILLVGFSDDFGDAMLVEEMAIYDVHKHITEGVPV